MNFNEQIFLRSLMDRPADARKYTEIFKPHWLKTAELQPILAKIFEFTKDKAIPPGINTLREMFIDEDKTAYDIRYKDTLDRLEAVEYTDDQVLYTLDKVKNIMISWSLEAMVQSPDFVQSLEHFEGGEVIKEVQKWVASFEGNNEDVEFKIQDAVEELIKTRGWNQPMTNIQTHIEFIDAWCGGGLRPRQLGIIMAPTGAGKSMCLMIMAYKMATVERKRVMFISNELSMGEITERFGTMIVGKDQDEVIDSPSLIRDRLSDLDPYKIRENLHLVEVNREISTNDIEAIVARNINLYGWAPEVVVVDYMERMKPIVTGMNRENTSGWFGEVAKDLIRMSKRTNTLVWTATQTNRSGYNSDVVQGIAQVQGSIKHLQEAAAVIAMRQRSDYTNATPSLKDTPIKILEFTALKMRHSRKDDKPILVEADFSKIAILKNYHQPSEWDKFDEDEKSGVRTTTGTNKRNRNKKKYNGPATP